MRKQFFKLDWMIDLEKKDFHTIHPRVYIKEIGKGNYKVVFQCPMCNLPSKESTRSLTTQRKTMNSCEHCDFTSEYYIKGHNVVIKSSLDKEILGVK